MSGMAPHALLPKQNSEERARHAFLIELKNVLTQDILAGVRDAYENEVKPDFEAEHGRPPANRHEVADALSDHPAYQMWSALGRIQQDLYVDSTAACVERQLPKLVETYRELAAAPKHGALRLSHNMTPPRYISAIDIHRIPGGYFFERGVDDVYVGARYDIGSFIFGRGQRGPMNDTRGQTGVAYVKRVWPDLAPKRILDMGCTAGMNTLPYVDAFPDAEVHGIDVSAPALRYAHGRSEALGRAVQFSQQDAESTDFEDASFDLVVSHILLHESSRQAVQNFFKECHRLLKPGGHMLHLDVPRRLTCTEPFDQFIADWDTDNNNEPFWGAFLFDMDIREAAIEAGFATEDVREELTHTPSRKSQYWALSATKRA
ncbi:MAG: methyltransferase domain-containing protein [Hyphomonadaceae bacterium]